MNANGRVKEDGAFKFYEQESCGRGMTYYHALPNLIKSNYAKQHPVLLRSNCQTAQHIKLIISFLFSSSSASDCKCNRVNFFSQLKSRATRGNKRTGEQENKLKMEKGTR